MPLLLMLLIVGTFTVYINIQAHASHADTLAPLTDMVPKVVTQSKLVGPANPQQTIALAFDLRLRNATELDTYIADMNTPKSINYHRNLSLAQLVGAFSPTQATHDALLHYMQSAGFTVTHTFKHRLVITFKGTIGQAEQTFHVSINNYVTPSGTTFYANATNPWLPSSLAVTIQSITGLSNLTRYHHAPIHMQGAHSSSTTSKGVQNATVTCPGAGNNYFLPSQMATAYNLNGLYNAGYHGEGQTVALFELAQFNMNDINAYRSCFDQNSPTVVQTVNVNGGPATPLNGDGGPAEVELDTELVLSAAPKLGLIKIYNAPNDPTDANAEWAQIVQDAIPVVSTSWGSCEYTMSFSEAQAEKNLFAMAVAQGQNIFAASADSGSSGCAFDANPTTNLSADDPAAQPYVIGVGGTTLHLNNNNTFSSETAWNDQPTGSASPQGGGSGGGISAFWQAPSWQSAPGVNNSYSRGTPCTASSGHICREVPDVSLNADFMGSGKGYLVYCTEAVSGCTSQVSGYPWIDFGGTSCAAPMWAAMMALTNEKSVKQGGFNIGFAAPLLYQIASNSSQYSSDFHDITSGTNDWDALQSGQYPATASYDMATGLGSFNALNLANDLVAAAHANNGSRLAPANSTWYFAEGSVGGGFQEYLTLQNPDPSQTSNVTITYLLQNHTPGTVTKQKTVPSSTRLTVDVDRDLGIASSGGHVSVAAIVKVTSGAKIVAERPMYFTFLGTIKSGTDVIGATTPGTSYYFSEGNSTQNSTSKYWTFVSILNPSSSNTANVTMTYYTGSCGTSGQPACPTESVQVGPLQRGTASPGDVSVGLHQKVAIKVASDQPIVVERPMYVSDTITHAGGVTTGAASQVGTTAPGTDWLFAEGYTGSGFQEYFELANFDPAHVATATVKLEFTDGSTQTFTVPVPASGLAQFDVNAHPGSNPSVSAEITSDKPIVVDRLMFFHFGGSHFSGITDVVGTSTATNVYAFAEGYTGNAFSEFLTLQNPTSKDELVAVTLFNQSGLVLQEQVTVVAHSRKTIGINTVISFAPSSVSMTVQALPTSTQPSPLIVAERPMYFGFAPGPNQTNGGTDVIGYTSGS